MFITRKKHEAIVKEMGRTIVARDDTLMIREATIGRLQRENAALLSELAPLKAARERRIAHLAAANARRKAQARDKQQAEVG